MKKLIALLLAALLLSTGCDVLEKIANGELKPEDIIDIPDEPETTEPVPDDGGEPQEPADTPAPDEPEQTPPPEEKHFGKGALPANELHEWFEKKRTKACQK